VSGRGSLYPAHKQIDERPHIRVTFDTSDLAQARSLRILEEADASGAFGPDGFRCRQLGSELYAVHSYPGGALALLEERQPISNAQETT
jgi:hypothetical protein